MTTTEAAPSLAELKEAALIRKAPKGVCVMAPCDCPAPDPDTGWGDKPWKCPKCKGKGQYKAALKPHPKAVDSAIRCPKCDTMLVVEMTLSPIMASGRVLSLPDPSLWWLCQRCPRHFDVMTIRSAVIQYEPYFGAALYTFLVARGRAMFKLGLKESAIAKEAT